MKNRIHVCILLLYVFLLTFATTASATVTSVRGQYLENATFLSHNYVKYSSYVSLVPDLANKMKNTYAVNYLFPNVGVLNSSGVITNAAAEMAQVKEFLNQIYTYEQANNYHFRVLAWVNADSAVVDVGSATVRTAIVDEAKKLTSIGPGTYFNGGNRAFDGIMMDIEPSGNNDTQFNNYKQLMIDIKSNISSSKLTGAAVHKYGTGSVWSWSPTYYYYMGRNVDLLVAMTYDSQATSSTGYQVWMKQQTKDILRAVSGVYWNDPSGHPAPSNGIKVFIGLPAFPSKPVHNPLYENITSGAQGMDAGVTDLKNDTTDQSESYFKGAAVYAHANGTSDPADTNAYGFASWATDWPAFNTNWLVP
jgi:hypothetical protein